MDVSLLELAIATAAIIAGQGGTAYGLHRRQAPADPIKTTDRLGRIETNIEVIKTKVDRLQVDVERLSVGG